MAAKQVTPAGAGVPVIDVDVHIHENAADLALFAENMLQQMLARDPGVEKWLDTPGYSPLTPYDPPLGQDTRHAPYVIRERRPMTSLMSMSCPDVSYPSVAERPNGSVTFVSFRGSAPLS